MNIIFFNSIITGILISIAAGPVGCLVVWNRLTYLGDCIAHASMLGIVVSVILKLNIFWGGAFITIASLSLFINYKSEIYPLETVIAIFSYLALSLALIIYSLNSEIYINLESFLFGDILSATTRDWIEIMIYTGCLLIWLKRNWSKLLMTIINRDLALVNRVNVDRLNMELIICTAGFVIFSIKAVGVLLVTALLIIPVVSSRLLSKSPESMVYISSLIGVISITVGILLSFIFDAPSGPLSIVVSGVCFMLLKILSKFRNKSVM